MRRHNPYPAADRAYHSSLQFHAMRGLPLAHQETVRVVAEQLLLIGVSQRIIAWTEFVFASFSAQYKIEEEVWGIWMQLLKRVPRSVLWLMNFSDESSDNVMAMARAHLGNEYWRVVITQLLPRKVETVVKGFWADLALDTWLINGHTTAAETSWHGLPMVVVPGSLHYHARLSSSISLSLSSPARSRCPSPPPLSAHLIARNPHDYYQIASAFALSALADHRSWRAFVPNVLAAPLFDGEAWTQAWERGLKMARDVQWMMGESEGDSAGVEDDVEACAKVYAGGEGGWALSPKSLRVCARAITKGHVTRPQLLGFNIIVA